MSHYRSTIHCGSCVVKGRGFNAHHTANLFARDSNEPVGTVFTVVDNRKLGYTAFVVTETPFGFRKAEVYREDRRARRKVA